jgi:hypothetical protein
MKHAIKILNNNSYRIGVQEIEGLEAAMREAFKPIQDLLSEKIYWSKVWPQNVEYKSRDGFIVNSHNCGGLRVFEVVPKCEEHDWNCLEFGESEVDEQGEYDDTDCDAALNIFFKFEGYDEDTGALSFYLNFSGGNKDAPYFRDIPTIFEREWTCKSVAGLKRASNKHIKALVEVLKG